MHVYQWYVRPWLSFLLVPCLMLLLGSTALPQEEKLDDKDITTAVEQELARDAYVPYNRIDVKTTDGVVTFTGTVQDLLAKKRATKLAETIKGVRSVINRIDVTPISIEDSALRKEIEEILRADPATDAYQISVVVNDGTVTLLGEVGSWPEKKLCTRLVQGVKGVVDVKNHIEVKQSAERSDSEIVTELERRLSFNVWLEGGDIDVDVNDGKVTLTGTVGSAAMKRRAGDLAWVHGVTAVDNQLKVEWWAREELKRKYAYTPKSDKEIARAIEDAFLYDPRVMAFNPEVAVENGVVTLRGIVDNLEAKGAAERDARNTRGVWMVKNLIKVRPDVEMSDEDIAERVRRTIRSDPALERHEITVTVYNGKVYLHGAVDSKFEKKRADARVARVKGVVDLENNLAVDRSWVAKTDWEIKKNVESELFWNSLIDSETITVTVSGGEVTLKGSVADRQAYHAATEEAYEGGARVVHNQLEIREGPAAEQPSPTVEK